MASHASEAEARASVARALRRHIDVTRFERVLAAYDIGRAINPKMVEGQIQGGFAQGLGGALMEEFIYDVRGQPLSLSLADYIMPTAISISMVSPVKACCLARFSMPSNSRPYSSVNGKERTYSSTLR